MKRILLLACALAFSSAALAQLYKSVDKDGRVIYSDQPPAAAESKPLKISPGPSPASSPSAKDREKELEKGRAAAQDKAKKDDEAAKKAKVDEENCNRAKTYLRTISDGGRISAIDAKGERIILDDKQVEEERAKAQKAVDQSCKAS